MKKHRKFLKDLQTSEQFYNDQESRQIIGELIAMIDEGFNKQKADWIPCEVELPKESNYYMACIYNADVDDFDFRKTWFAHKDDYDMENSEWRELYEFETVTAWQPLPQPYKKEGDSDAS